MVVIGITGMIASGKSTVSNMIKEEYNAVIFDADKVAKEVISDLKINNENVVNNPMRLYQVEADIMPTFKERLEDFININKEKNIIILDIPLLYEFSLEKYCDKTINIYCNFETRVKRIQTRQNMNIEKFMFLNNKQMNDEERNSRADYSVSTEKTQEEVFNKVKEIINSII